jgi:lysophospholipase L1-like esterase
MRALITLTCSILLLGCGEDELERRPIPEGATIIAIGDSVFEWNIDDGESIPDVIGEELGRVVYNAAISGAYFTDEEGEEPLMDIREQYVEHPWEWLVLEGGGNDFNDECGCTECEENLDGIISADGQSGALPEFVRSVVDQGVQVVVWGYYDIPPTAEYGFADCDELVAIYSERQALFAESHEDVWFVDGREAFDSSDLENYDDDHVHPSPSGSQRVGEAIAEQILEAEQ